MSLSKLNIAPTQNTPGIVFEPSGLIKISGRSLDICSMSFMASLDEWLEKYVSCPADNTNVVVELDYLNRVNIRYFSTLLLKLNSVRLLNKKITINWIYEEGDEDMHEIGDLISTTLKMPFNFVVREEDEAPLLKKRGMNLPLIALA
jgi:hypothetical protein